MMTSVFTVCDNVNNTKINAHQSAINFNILYVHVIATDVVVAVRLGFEFDAER